MNDRLLSRMARGGTGLALALVSGSAWAQSSDAATAQALFEQGRALLQAGNAAQACPKLAESHRLDPGTGALLALALCHEKEGKLASAWAEFNEVQGRARREGRSDRDKSAQEHAGALRGRLSTLLIQVPPSIASLPGLEIRRNGILLGRGAWNVAVPVDGGGYSIRASAPGKKTWESNISIKFESDRVFTTVPNLDPAPIATALPTVLPRPQTAPKTSGDQQGDHLEQRKWGTAQWIGATVLGAGVITMGVGGYYLATALQRKSASNNDCVENFCGDDGLAYRNEAVHRGNAATVLGVAGAVLGVGGLVLIVTGPSAARERSSAVSASFGAMPGGFAGMVTGTF
jgi:hypothetical protein